MKKRWTIALVGTLSLAALLVFSAWWFDNEGPEYGGKPFHHWCELAVRLDAEAIPAMREGLKHWNPDVRHSSATYLSYFGPRAEAAIPDLAAALRGDRDADVRWAAGCALRNMGATSSDALVALKSALKDEDPRVRQNAELALESIRAQAAVAGSLCGMVGAAAIPRGLAGLSAFASLAGSTIAFDQAK